MLTNIIEFWMEWSGADAAGIIYYPNYYRWFDRATHELFRKAGMPTSELRRMGFIHPLLESGARYYHPCLYDDLVTLEAVVRKLRTKLSGLNIKHCGAKR